MKPLPLALALTACAITNPVPGIGDAYYRTGTLSVTKYAVTVTRHTPVGVAVDDPKGEISDATIDNAFAHVEACLARHAGKLTASQTAMHGGMFCHRSIVPATIDRHSLLVKVAPDWHTSKCTGEQLFPCSIDSAGCTAKGLPDMPGCPCECRHAVQWDSVLVITPNGKLLNSSIVEAVTGCENIWVGELAECGAP